MEENPTNNLVSISNERLAELEALESKLPSMIEDAILEHKQNNLRRLHERDKANPESVKARVKRYIAKNRDKINERRREKRREQKKILDSQTRINTSVMRDILSVTEHKPNGIAILNNDSYIPGNEITVRFDD